MEQKKDRLTTFSYINSQLKYIKANLQLLHLLLKLHLYVIVKLMRVKMA